jgi:cephalosporin-C deacetylase
MNLFDMSLNQLEEYMPELTKKPDFHSFWDSRIKENTQYPLNIEVKDRVYPVKGIKVKDVYFDGFRNSRLHAVYISPMTIQESKPVAVIFHGYNWNTLQPHYAFKHVIQGIPVLMIEIRGQNIESPDKNQYDNGGSAGWLTLGINTIDNYYYTHVYMDCFRAVDVARKLSGKTSVYLEGASQGGAMAIAVAALQKNIQFALCDIPFLSHFERSIKLASDGPYKEIYHYFKVHDPLHKTSKALFETLSYIDCMNLAERVMCPTLMSVGLEDTICPPSSVFAIYNHLNCSKEIRVYPEYGHEVPSIHEEVKLQFIASHIG